MTGTQIKIPRSVVQKYLDAKEGRSVKILEYEKLGSGWHGTGYKVKFSASGGQIKEVVLRTLMPANFLMTGFPTGQKYSCSSMSWPIWSRIT